MKHIGVVIPARDEEELIARCLRAVTRAADRVDARVTIVVAADGCLDRTVEIARSFAGVTVLELESSNVGAARAAASNVALSLGVDWLANTDADSVVPDTWLHEQLLLESAGADVVIGTVRPDPAELTVSQAAAWRATHHPGRPNGHVHGANLGLRASAYLAVGGYRALPEHEDADLVARLSGSEIVATDSTEVITSARRFGRTPGGYARYLRENLLGSPAADQIALAADSTQVDPWPSLRTPA
jgi:glycosyltransferase involved in cell wall biosynthesis